MQYEGTIFHCAKRIGPHDLQIAAFAVQNGLTLITHNTREFDRIPGLKIEDWEL
jgi:tRNA(fMet)-specific endonuclease VapC